MIIGVDYTGVTTPFYCNDGKGNFLLHKRSKKCRDEQGHWEPGGGKLEFGQTLEESVLREVKEEYGCKGKIQEQLPAYTMHRENAGKITHWVAVPFFILVDKKAARINDPEKMDQIGWFTLNNLPKPLHTGFKQALGRYQKYFDNYKLKYQPNTG